MDQGGLGAGTRRPKVGCGQHTAGGQQGRAATQACHGQDLLPPVVAHQGRRPDGLVVGKVDKAQGRAAGFQIARQCPGGFAFVKLAWASLGQSLQQAGLVWHGAACHRRLVAGPGRTARVEKQGGTGRVLRQAGGVYGQREAGEPIQLQAQRGVMDGRLQRVGPAQRPVFLQRAGEPGNRPGHADRAVARHIAVALNGRPIEPVAVVATDQGVVGRVQTPGCQHIEIQGINRPRVSVGMQQKAAAADARQPGLHHTENQRRDNGRIHGIAPLGQHRSASLGSMTVLRRNQAMARVDSRFVNAKGLHQGTGPKRRAAMGSGVLSGTMKRSRFTDSA